jgi:hypothetical protein
MARLMPHGVCLPLPLLPPPLPPPQPLILAMNGRPAIGAAAASKPRSGPAAATPDAFAGLGTFGPR